MESRDWSSDVCSPIWSWSDLHGERETWDSLLGNWRTVILAEAGAGKTHEMETVTRRLVQEGRSAFLIQITDLADQPLMDALSLDDGIRFKLWKETNTEGWFFLDSVDEAKLDSLHNFKRALKRLSHELGIDDLDRAHIYISCRVSNWQANLDRSVVSKNLLIESKSQVVKSERSEEGVPVEQVKAIEPEDLIHIFGLSALTPEQMRQFIQEQGGVDTDAVMSALEYADAYHFAERPLDLLDKIGRAHV